MSMENNDSSPLPSTINQHFLRSIRSSTLVRIEIPDPFYKSFEKEEHGTENVTLVSLPLTHKWKVKREGRELTHGWTEFTTAHMLQAGDYVIFKHKGGSVFEVATLGKCGSQLNYGYNQLRESGNQRGNPSRQGCKQQHELEEEGNAPERKKRVATDKQRGVNQLLKADGGKKYKKTVPEEPNALYQVVTSRNIDRNSVYIPVNFVNLHCLKDKNMEQMAITTKEGYVWEAIPRPCVDDRMEIVGGWSDFCTDNNMQVGDLCKFNLIEDTEFIVLEFDGLSEESKQPSKRSNQSTIRSDRKGRQSTDARRNQTANSIETEISSVEDLFKWAERELALEKGQSSRSRKK